MSTGSTTVRVSWVPPPADSRNGVITQYSVAYEAVDGEDRGRHVVDGISREHSSWDLVGLEKWTEYRVWVRAHTDVGPGPESSPVLVRTDEDGRRHWHQVGGRGEPQCLGHQAPGSFLPQAQTDLPGSGLIFPKGEDGCWNSPCPCPSHWAVFKAAEALKARAFKI